MTLSSGGSGIHSTILKDILTHTKKDGNSNALIETILREEIGRSGIYGRSGKKRKLKRQHAQNAYDSTKLYIVAQNNIFDFGKYVDLNNATIEALERGYSFVMKDVKRELHNLIASGDDSISRFRALLIHQGFLKVLQSNNFVRQISNVSSTLSGTQILMCSNERHLKHQSINSKRHTKLRLSEDNSHESIETLLEELRASSGSLEKYNKLVDNNIAWVQTNCNIKELYGTLPTRAKRKCKLLATSKLINVFAIFFLKTLRWSFTEWKSNCLFIKLEKDVITYCRIKCVQKLSMCYYNLHWKALSCKFSAWKNRISLERDFERHSSVTVIQRLVRGFIGRRRLRNLRILKNVLYIQSFFRMTLVKWYVSELKQKMAQEDAAFMLQNFLRSRYNINIAKNELNRRRKEKAATQIQKLFRGQQLRNEKQDEANNPDIDKISALEQKREVLINNTLPMDTSSAENPHKKVANSSLNEKKRLKITPDKKKVEAKIPKKSKSIPVQKSKGILPSTASKRPSKNAVNDAIRKQEIVELPDVNQLLRIPDTYVVVDGNGVNSDECINPVSDTHNLQNAQYVDHYTTTNFDRPPNSATFSDNIDQNYEEDLDQHRPSSSRLRPASSSSRSRPSSSSSRLRPASSSSSLQQKHQQHFVTPADIQLHDEKCTALNTTAVGEMHEQQMSDQTLVDNCETSNFSHKHVERFDQNQATLMQQEELFQTQQHYNQLQEQQQLSQLKPTKDIVNPKRNISVESTMLQESTKVQKDAAINIQKLVRGRIVREKSMILDVDNKSKHGEITMKIADLPQSDQTNAQASPPPFPSNKDKEPPSAILLNKIGDDSGREKHDHSIAPLESKVSPSHSGADYIFVFEETGEENTLVPQTITKLTVPNTEVFSVATEASAIEGTRNFAAQKVQGLIRKFLAYHKVMKIRRRMKRCQSDATLLLMWSIISIQRVIRGKLGRSRFLKRKMLMFEKKNECAVIIQRRIRGINGRQKYAEKKKRYDEEQKQVEIIRSYQRRDRSEVEPILLTTVEADKVATPSNNPDLVASKTLRVEGESGQENNIMKQIDEKLMALADLEKRLKESEEKVRLEVKLGEEKVQAQLRLLEEKTKQVEAERKAREELMQLAVGPLSHRSPFATFRGGTSTVPSSARSNHGVKPDTLPILVNGNEWSKLWDASNQTFYWWCDKLQVAQWDDPRLKIPQPEQENDNVSIGGLTDYSTDGDEQSTENLKHSNNSSPWQEYWDEQAQAKYWYNNETGEASWTLPDAPTISANNDSSKYQNNGWVSYIDEETGHLYWHNIYTGEVQWDV